MTGSPVSGSAQRAFVWVWLPGATDPIVAGVVAPNGDILEQTQVLVFRYAASYLARPDAISLFTPELPLTGEMFDPRRPGGAAAKGAHRDPLPLAGCLRDAAPTHGAAG